MIYSMEDIKNNNNLIFNLRVDMVFKSLFNTNAGIKYIELILNKLLKINIDNLYINSTELPNINKFNKSSFSDLILKDNINNYIIEMNNFKTKYIFYKNNYYLIKHHSNRCYRKNNYGNKIKTILINIDNYDHYGKNDFIYRMNYVNIKYNEYMYKNIETININLAYLNKKYYNGDKLNELEKLFIIFIEQRKDKILKIINNEIVRAVLKKMDEYKCDEFEGLFYDKEEFDRKCKEEWDRNKLKKEKQFERINKKLEIKKLELENKDKELENKDKELNNKGIELRSIEKNLDSKEKNLDSKEKNLDSKEKNLDSKEKNLDSKEKNLDSKEKNLDSKEKNLDSKEKQLNKKIYSFAKELKKLNYPIDKIIEFTDLSKNQIDLL